jgi:hypothetical protein
MRRTEPTQPAASSAPRRSRSATASRYVAGRSREEALDCAAGLLEQGHGVSIDCFGELVRDPIAAGRTTKDYLELAKSLLSAPANAWLSLDLTHLALDLDAGAVANRLEAIARGLPPGRRVQIGAEDARPRPSSPRLRTRGRQARIGRPARGHRPGKPPALARGRGCADAGGCACAPGQGHKPRGRRRSPLR